jgi:hypothetical protein
MHAEPYSIGQVTSYRWAGPGSSIATLGMSDLEKLPAPLPLWRLGMDRRLSSADRGEVIAIDLWTLDLMRRQTHGGGVHKKRKTPCWATGQQETSWIGGRWCLPLRGRVLYVHALRSKVPKH